MGCGRWRYTTRPVTLAALAMEYGLVLQSTDHDFARFEGLRWENPLTR